MTCALSEEKRRGSSTRSRGKESSGVIDDRYHYRAGKTKDYTLTAGKPAVASTLQLKKVYFYANGVSASSQVTRRLRGKAG